MDLLLLYDSIGLLISGYREASHLAAVLKEMKEGLDAVRGKVQALTAKVLDSLSDDSQIHVFFFCQVMLHYFLNLSCSAAKSMVACYSFSTLKKYIQF